MYSEYKDHQNSVQSLITAGKSPESTLKMLLKNKDTFESFMYFQKEAGVDAVPMIREAIIRDALRVSAGTADDIPKLNKFKTQIAQARKGIDPDLRRQILDSSGGAEAIKDTEDILTVYEVLKRTQKRFSDYNEDSVRAMLQSGKMSKGLIAALRKHFPEMNQAARDATTSLFERRAINFGGAMGRAYSPAQYDTTQGPYPEMSALTGQGRQPGVNMPTAEDNKFMNLGQLLRGATQ